MGELQKWHKITIRFLMAFLQVNQTAPRTPFTDFWLDVNFAQALTNKMHIVPLGAVHIGFWLCLAGALQSR